MREFAIVVRAGKSSTHPVWLNGPRNWDLIVSWYDRDSAPVDPQCVMVHCCRGPKWAGISDLLENSPELCNRYRYIWFPDDDLIFPGGAASLFFELCDQLQLAVAQPALSQDSHLTWEITRQVPGQVCRFTDFVEIMAPCFRADALRILAPSFSENRSGWGYEWLWRRLLAPDLRFGVVDYTPVLHARPVGSAGHGGIAGEDSRAEGNALLRKYQLRQTLPNVLAGLPLSHPLLYKPEVDHDQLASGA